MSTTLTQNQYVITSAYRTLQVLLAFGVPPYRFSLAEIVVNMGLEKSEKSQVYRSLKTLEEAGFLRTEDDGRFALTPVMNVLSAASANSRQASLVEIAKQHLDRIAAQTEESVHLFVLAGEHAVCVDRRDSLHQVRLASVLGRSVPLHAGAVPKAILAHLPEARRRAILTKLSAYPRYTDKTLLTPQRLEADLEQIRERGYSISDEDYDASARGVGAPIFDHTQQVVGGVSVGGPSFRVADDALKRFGSLITLEARAISQRLGYPG